MRWQFDDGGRAAAGFKGTADDCATRAIAIATGIPYRDVYDYLAGEMANFGRPRSARNGIRKEVWKGFMNGLGGWIWVPTMCIGSGCTVHLADGELPDGRLVAQVTKHVCAVIDGVIHDNHDPSRGSTRCVYGFYRKEPS